MSPVGTTSSAKIIVSISSTVPSWPGRMATSCSLERRITRAIATRPDSFMAFSSSP